MLSLSEDGHFLKNSRIAGLFSVLRPILDHPGTGLFSFYGVLYTSGRIWVRWIIAGFVGFWGQFVGFMGGSLDFWVVRWIIGSVRWICNQGQNPGLWTRQS